MSKKHVVLIGGGNSTLCLLPFVVQAGHTVTVLSRQPSRWSTRVHVDIEDETWGVGSQLTTGESATFQVTSDYAAAIPDAHCIWICGVPIHHNRDILRHVAPYLRQDVTVFVGTICAYGGFDQICQEEFTAHAPNGSRWSLFGTQVIPWCCGTRTYGEHGVIYGAKRILRIATRQGNDVGGIKDFLSPILRIPLADASFIGSNLFPNNAWLHPPILCGLFEQWDMQQEYEASALPTYIYGQLSANSITMLHGLQRDMTGVLKALQSKYPRHKIALYNLRDCILENYEDQVSDPRTLESSISSNAAFSKHTIPYQRRNSTSRQHLTGTEQETEWWCVPDRSHKFFVSDLPYGLVPFKDYANQCGVNTPWLDRILLWNQRMTGNHFFRYQPATGTLVLDEAYYDAHRHECFVPSKMLS